MKSAVYSHYGFEVDMENRQWTNINLFPSLCYWNASGDKVAAVLKDGLIERMF